MLPFSDFLRLTASDTLSQALNCVVDFMCVGIPFVAVWGLEKVNMRTKVGLYALLCGGLITAACSIGRVNALDFHSADQTCKPSD